MSFPGAFAATVPPEKIRDYLLDLDHPVGRSKAVWFLSLGYAADRWSELADDLKRVAAADANFDVRPSPFGTKYLARGTIGRPGFRPGTVLTVWMSTDGGPPRFITAHPD